MKLITEMLVFFVVCFLEIFALAACTPNPDEAVQITVSDLVNNPKDFLNQTVVVKGEITNYLGESEYTRLIPYVSLRPCGKNFCSVVLLNASEVKVKSFTFFDGDFSITIAEDSKAAYLPIPFSPPAPDPEDIPLRRMEITGIWRKQANGNYYLEVSETKDIP